MNKYYYQLLSLIKLIVLVFLIFLFKKFGQMESIHLPMFKKIYHYFFNYCAFIIIDKYRNLIVRLSFKKSLITNCCLFDFIIQSNLRKTALVLV